MSLRRPFRDSWEQREYKRPARSLSPLADKPSWTPIRRLSPSPERSQASVVSHHQDTKLPPRYASPTAEDDTDSDNDYQERRALTSEPESEAPHKTANKKESRTGADNLFEQPAWPRQSPFTVYEFLGASENPLPDIFSPTAAISPRTSKTLAPLSGPDSNPSTIYPLDSVSNPASVASASGPLADSLIAS